MNYYNIIIAIVVCFLLYKIYKNTIIEEYANDFNHYSFMNDYATKIREEGLKKIFKFYGMDSEGNVLESKEDFDIERKTILVKEEPINDIKEFVLEEDSKSINVNEKNLFAKYLEVEEYNSGSGDLTNVNQAFDILDEQNNQEQLNFLYSRGGNVYKKKE